VGHLSSPFAGVGFISGVLFGGHLPDNTLQYITKFVPITLWITFYGRNNYRKIETVDKFPILKLKELERRPSKWP